MPDKVWLCLETLAASVDEDGNGEEIIDQLEKDIIHFSPAKYLRTKEHLNIAIAQLSRLAMRIKEKEAFR